MKALALKINVLPWRKLWILSVPDEGYSRNGLCAINLITTFLFTNTNKNDEPQHDFCTDIIALNTIFNKHVKLADQG
jgi:hypothetical protein